MSGSQDPWAQVALLAEPTRRSIYEAVRAARAPMTRDAVAAATGSSRRLVAFHLDVLAEAGLVAVDFARPAGRSGPGAGRPAKRYAAVQADVEVSLPRRRYDLPARVLATAVDSDPTDARTAAGRVARDEGKRIGAAARGPGRRRSAATTLDEAAAVLDAVGYEPQRCPEGVRLRNCPFAAVVDVAPGLVCGLNEDFVQGLLEGMDGHRSVQARLEPHPPDCCVVVSRR